MTESSVSSEPQWLELTVTVRGARPAQTVLDLLVAEGIENVVEQDASTLDGTDLEPDQKRLVAYLEAEHAALGEALVARLERERTARGLELSVALRPFEDTSWRDGWKAFFRPARVSPRLAVRAPWAELEVPPSVETLIIEPGMAFGTGLHETTRLCLEAIDRALACEQAGATRMLDVGCGSGVLAIAAARLGVKQCTGLDLDPVAVEVSAENAERNGTAEACHFATTEVGALAGAWPLVVANILGPVLIEHRDVLVDRTEPGGRLVLSGLLVREEAGVIAAFEAGHGQVRLERRHSLGEWSCLELVRGEET